MWGARKPQFLSRNLATNEVISAVRPNYSFRQLPWDSVYTYIVEFRQRSVRDGGREQMHPVQFLAKIGVSGAAYPNFRFRQLPRASVDYRLQIYGRI